LGGEFVWYESVGERVCWKALVAMLVKESRAMRLSCGHPGFLSMEP
jgi:hypothetical protein